MKLFAWVCAVVFALFALVQLNDPDPVGWFAMYLGAAGLWVMAAYDKAAVWLCAAVAAVVAVWMYVWWPGFAEWLRIGTMAQLVGALSMEKPYIEEAREFLGLGLILVSATFLGVRRRSPRTR